MDRGRQVDRSRAPDREPSKGAQKPTKKEKKAKKDKEKTEKALHKEEARKLLQVRTSSVSAGVAELHRCPSQP
jgi:hypothetical protein